MAILAVFILQDPKEERGSSPGRKTGRHSWGLESTGGDVPQERRGAQGEGVSLPGHDLRGSVFGEGGRMEESLAKDVGVLPF